jgi:RNA polymerase sigma-70 factor (ECF subfamily)
MRKNELQEQIRLLIDELGQNDREILTLRHAEGLSNAEVADLLEINPNSVRQRYGRALRRLHERLAAQGISMDSGSLP